MDRAEVAIEAEEHRERWNDLDDLVIKFKAIIETWQDTPEAQDIDISQAQEYVADAMYYLGEAEPYIEDAEIYGLGKESGYMEAEEASSILEEAVANLSEAEARLVDCQEHLNPLAELEYRNV